VTVQKVQITRSAAIARVVTATVIAAMVGAYPTWLFGQRAVTAELTAWVIVTLVASAATAILVGQAKYGPVRLAAAFLFSSTAKVIVCVALGVGAWYALGIEFNPLFLWICLFYVVNLIVQCVWLVRMLRRS
jgi:hypothetical protein